jgi:hypothetical protein
MLPGGAVATAPAEPAVPAIGSVGFIGVVGGVVIAGFDDMGRLGAAAAWPAEPTGAVFGTLGLPPAGWETGMVALAPVPAPAAGEGNVGSARLPLTFVGSVEHEASQMQHSTRPLG